MRVVSTIAVIVALALVGAANAEPKERLGPRAATIAAAVTSTWTCQDHLGVVRSKQARSPWTLPPGAYRAWVLNLWVLRRADCRAALVEKKRQWNWQAFPSWVVRLAMCESGANWFAEGSSRDGTFYSAFNISRSVYDRDAHHMGVRGWREGPGVPSPYEQAMAVIGHVRLYGDGFTGRCHGIARSSWN